MALYKQVEFLDKTGQVEQLSMRHWNGRYAEIHHRRWVNGVLLRRGEEALQVNWFEITITREDKGQRLYKNSFISNHSLTAGNMVPIAREGRARWKSENETNNVLKAKGYLVEHNFEHGQQFLANSMVTLTCWLFCSIRCWKCCTNSTACCANVW